MHDASNSLVCVHSLHILDAWCNTNHQFTIQTANISARNSATYLARLSCQDAGPRCERQVSRQLEWVVQSAHSMASSPPFRQPAPVARSPLQVNTFTPEHKHARPRWFTVPPLSMPETSACSRQRSQYHSNATASLPSPNHHAHTHTHTHAKRDGAVSKLAMFWHDVFHFSDSSNSDVTVAPRVCAYPALGIPFPRGKVKTPRSIHLLTTDTCSLLRAHR